ncbi:MAG: fumarate hydratase [candidate division KSB1 bacterium]|nr:fumarate hydratase [candidate division KSB1 bacterium]
MREIAYSQIVEAVKELCLDANYRLDASMIRALEEARRREESPAGRKILDHLLENARIAASGENPLCQDTGLAVFFIELGQEVHLAGGRLEDAVNEGVRCAYREGYLRNSVVDDPLRRRNTGDNTPAVIWLDLVPGDRLRIDMAPKGAGSENMSGLAMLKPSQGEEGVIDFVVDWISRAGGNPCPPIIVGVGLGGTFEKAAWLAKKAILRELGERHPDPYYAQLEERLLERINALGIGPMGFGGRTTALDVHIEVYPCHIASLPVAVNIQCHSARHKRIIL